MEFLCPECSGTLETHDGETARCRTHGGEFRILFSRWQPPLPPAPAPAEYPPPPVISAEGLDALGFAAPPPGAMCSQHSRVPAVFVCQECNKPICATCAFAMEGGGQMCPECVGRLPGLQMAAQPTVAPAPPPLINSVPEGVHCVQHRHLQATQQCQTCGAFVCATCDFALPGGVHLCPACATEPKPTLSPRRKKFLVGSFALAIWCTIGFGILLSGALAGSVPTKEDEQALGMAIMVLLMAPAIAGMALGFSAVDRRLSNPPVLWVATLWNALIVGGFLLLSIIGNLQ